MQQKPQIPKVLWRVMIHRSEDNSYGTCSRCDIIKNGKIRMVLANILPNHKVFVDNDATTWVRNDYGLFKVDDEPIDQGQGLEGWFSSQEKAEACLFKHLPPRQIRNHFQH